MAGYGRIHASICAAAAATLLSACNGANAPDEPEGPSATASSARVAEPVDLRKFILDPTRSSVPSFAQQVVSDVSTDILLRYPPAPSEPPTTSKPGIRGLHLWVRVVTTDCYSTTSPSAEIYIPSVPALEPPPAIDDPDLAVDDVSWAADAVNWQRAMQRASQQAAAGASRIRELTLDPNSHSGIWACFAAITKTGPQNPDVKTLAATDLQNNQPLIDTHLFGGEVIIVQSCPQGWGGTCDEYAQTWKTDLSRQGAGPVTIVRADSASSAIAQWLGVTP